VFGFILPAERIARLCHAARVPFVLDASQSAGCLPIDAAALPGTYIAMPGHKGLYGPQGTGLLISPKGTLPEPLLRGGTGSRSADMSMPGFLPDRLEAGTHNLPGVAGLLEGLRYVRRRGSGGILRAERALTEAALRALSGHPRLRVYRADHLFCQTGVLSFTVEGMDAECVAERLSQKGIAVRAGLHCAPAAHRSAQTFPAGTVRVSFSAFNTLRDVEVFARALARIL
jgi:selenocysteine lyase/cysteine desulfurase